MSSNGYNDYHILVAQNFLSNLSKDGTHLDTKLRIFSTRGLPKDANSNVFTSHRQEASSNTLKSSIENCLDNISNSDISPLVDNLNKKPSLFRRLAKIVSSDDIINKMQRNVATDETISEVCESDGDHLRAEFVADNNQFGFLRRLRSTLSHGERWYFCSEVSHVPLAIFSNMTTNDPEFSNIPGSKKTRARSIFGSVDKMRFQSHPSCEELRPFSFKDNEEHLVYGNIRRVRRSITPFFTLFDKPCRRDRRDSRSVGVSEDFSDADVFRDGNIEKSPETEDGDESEEEAYDSVTFEEMHSARKTVIRLGAFVGSTLHYLPAERAKSAMNEDFIEKYPRIHLTLSKLKSIKHEMCLLALRNCIDCFTLATAVFYFESIVLKGLISKINRKCIAGVSLLVAMKLNDYGKSNIQAYLTSAEEQLRVSRGDIVSFELPLCASLRFRLLPSADDVGPHYDRLLFELP